jgi:formate/nitrite transporter
MANSDFSLDALIPTEMAAKAEEIGVKKANMAVMTTFVLAILAGAFVAVGAIFMTTVTAGSMVVKLADGTAGSTISLPFGVVRVLGGLGFSLGLIMCLVGGAELFTGNNLIVMAFINKRVSFAWLMRNWGIVYVGNFVGSLLTAVIMFSTQQYTFASGGVGLNMLVIGEAKTNLGFFQAVALGMMCNALVCMAVWMTYSARTTTDRILAIVPPITAFVAASFEHSVANMYLIPVALFVKSGADPAFFGLINKTPADFPHLTWINFLVANLLPVTIGNIIGGAVMVGVVYWFVYRRKTRVDKP